MQYASSFVSTYTRKTKINVRTPWPGLMELTQTMLREQLVFTPDYMIQHHHTITILHLIYT